MKFNVQSLLPLFFLFLALDAVDVFVVFAVLNLAVFAAARAMLPLGPF